MRRVDRHRIEKAAAPWLEPGETVRRAIFARTVPRFAHVVLPGHLRILLATDRHIYVMRRGIREVHLISDVMEKLDIRAVRVSFRRLSLRIEADQYWTTTPFGIRDARRLVKFVLEKQVS
jgi:hypothetical protein